MDGRVLEMLANMVLRETSLNQTKEMPHDVQNHNYLTLDKTLLREAASLAYTIIWTSET